MNKKSGKRVVKRIVIAALAASVFAAAPAMVQAADVENLIPGGDFEVTAPEWGLYKESGGTAEVSVADGRMTVQIESAGTVAHAVQVYCDGFKLIKGAKYRMSFDMTSEVERTFEWRVQLNGGDYHAYAGDPTAAAGPEETHYSYEFVMEEETDPAPRFAFNLGDAQKEQGLGAHFLIIDNVTLELLEGGEEIVEEQEEMGRIIVDQVGYKTDALKRVGAKGAEVGTAFSVIDIDSEQEVYSGTFKEEIYSEGSGDTVVWGDFSDVKDAGEYLIRVEGIDDSYAFSIGNAVYADALTDLLHMFYLQRCGEELTAEYAGDFAHAVCHTEEAAIYGTDEKLEVSGGWHDAGDYGRYVVAGAKAAADLMLTYEAQAECNSVILSDETNIPESGNGVPDILDEVRYELDWMLKMQTAEGGVYHKVTGLEFDDVIMPEKCSDPLYVLPVSQTATADFAAVMYMAARVYANIDEAFAADCLAVADLALEYAGSHLDDPGFTNPSDVVTGEYPDTDSQDEYLWALCEAGKTKKDSSIFENALKERALNLDLGWQDVTGYAYYAAMTTEGASDSIVEMWLAAADTIVDITAADSYGSSIEKDYPWGSNMTIANNGMVLLIAYEMSGNEGYKEAAAKQVDYLLGCNVTGYSYLTGYGSLAPEHPHHRPSQSVGKAVPGMLVGGPDSALEDPYAKGVLEGKADAACYADSDQSYSTNEITIYWNSPFVYLLSGYDALS